MSGYYNRNNRGITKKLGPVTAYADAVLAGYKGTREQWAQDMAKLGQNVTQVAQNTKLTTELAEQTRVNTEQVEKDTADVRRLADETSDNAAQVASNTEESNRLAEETKQAAAQAKEDAEYAGAAADNFRVDTTLSEEGKAAEAKTTGEKFAQLSEEKVHKVNRSVNIFNGDFVNGYISDGKLIPDNNLYCTSRIPVEAGDYLYKSNPNQFGGNAAKVFSYTAEGVYVGEVTATLLDASRSVYTVRISASSNIRINVGTVYDVQTFMFVSGNVIDDYPTEYVPYEDGEKYEEKVHLSNTNKDDVVVITNPLYGKKISVTGDSICYGNGFVGGYAKMIADGNNMTMQNIAVGGGTIVPQSGRFDISASITSLDTDADYIIIEGGVNDSAIDGIEIGEFSRSFEQPTNRNTFYTALDYALYNLVHRFSGKKYGFVIVHQMSGKLCNINGDGATFYNAIIKCCEKWGVPVCDLNVSVPPFGLLPTTDLMRITYTTNNDGWHPTEECYRKYYVPKIEAWMKTL